MKYLILTSLLFSSVSMAKQCVNLSGKYKINLKQDCSRRSYKSIKRTTNFELQPYSMGYSLHPSEEELEIEIIQKGCQKFTIKQTQLDRYYPDENGNPVERDHYSSWQIQPKNITDYGFNLGRKGFDFDSIFLIYEWQKMSIKQKEEGSNKVLSIMSFNWNARIYSIGTDNIVNCDLHQVE